MGNKRENIDKYKKIDNMALYSWVQSPIYIKGRRCSFRELKDKSITLHYLFVNLCCSDYFMKN